MSTPHTFSPKRYYLSVAIAASLWFFAYALTAPLSLYLTYSVLGIEAKTHLGDAVEFFIYDTVKILLLLVGLIYVIAWIRSAISIERIRDFLMGKKRVFGYALGSFFGAVTPFCSCSSIPLFLGFISARIPLGITMAFLITSPLINEVAIVMLWGILGWKFTVAYVTVGIVAGMAG
ncbi:MAG: permease, partial [Saezia sp.]